jgi:MFS family permease
MWLSLRACQVCTIHITLSSLQLLTEAVLSPLVSSMFTPGIAQIAEDLNCSTTAVVGTTTGYVVMLGIGPLLLAPLSETFGRRNLYLTCFSIFTLLQIPTGFAPNIGFLIAIRSVAGFFGSVGVANGGGTISGMMTTTDSDIPQKLMDCQICSSPASALVSLDGTCLALYLAQQSDHFLAV